MVDSGHAQVTRFAFRPLGAVGDLEILRWRDLERRATAEVWGPHRLDFHQLLLVRQGTLSLRVDFDEMHCAAGSVAWVRPGQVQQFGPHSGVEARLVLFRGDFPAPAPALPALVDGPLAPLLWRLGDELSTRAATAVDVLEYASAGHGASLSTQMARHTLTALLLGLGDATPSGGTAPRYSDVFSRFHAELELSFRTTRRAEDYARGLGYAPRTLSRACHAITGRSAKELIDARVVLEAKRELAHTTLPIESIAFGLGFSQATNFTKFFARHAGTSPGTFRASVHRDVS